VGGLLPWSGRVKGRRFCPLVWPCAGPSVLRDLATCVVRVRGCMVVDAYGIKMLQVGWGVRHARGGIDWSVRTRPALDRDGVAGFALPNNDNLMFNLVLQFCLGANGGHSLSACVSVCLGIGALVYIPW